MIAIADPSDLVAAAVAGVIGVVLVVRRESWGRDVMGIQAFERHAPIVVAAVGILFLLAAIWLLMSAIVPS